MKQKILFVSAVLLFGLTMVVFTSSSLEAIKYPCDCFDIYAVPSCPSGYSYAGVTHLSGDCGFVDCLNRINLKCKCDTCGSIQYYYHTVRYQNCQECIDHAQNPPLP